MRTLIWKELRENARWLPVGLILLSLVAWMVAPRSFQHQSQITLGLLDYLSILLPALALALGILQSIRDLQPAPGAYLRHRGVTSNQIFLAKLVAGFAIYAAAVTLPLLVMALWIAMQGMHWTPMRPAQVIPPMVCSTVAKLGLRSPHVLDASLTHRRLSYPLPGCTSAEARFVSPSGLSLPLRAAGAKRLGDH